ncbi:hypothetical protein DES45_10557 [Microvirga subterranea]|uniref:Uncharacterized protein n=1 Tax=Microvirga subterranea TaxID=186651 RepID=A0A370HNP8_9HYPH|nr:hypothetical protein DES45_10557 [Microvirga subterranea]
MLTTEGIQYLRKWQAGDLNRSDTEAVGLVLHGHCGVSSIQARFRDFEGPDSSLPQSNGRFNDPFIRPSFAKLLCISSHRLHMDATPSHLVECKAYGASYRILRPNVDVGAATYMLQCAP